MKVSGTALLHAHADQVWAALHDPAVLVRTIPGCERLEAIGPDAYSMVVTAGVASIKGTYAGKVALSEQQAPHSFLLTASGSGGPGTVSTDVRVALADLGDGSTKLAYDADAVVGGMVGGVGQRMLAAVAKKTAGEFFAAVDDVLTGKAGAVAGAPAVADTSGDTSVYTALPTSTRGSGGFLRGIVVGALVALGGAIVGGLLGRRR